MPGKLDPQLEYLVEAGVADLDLGTAGRFGITTESFKDAAVLTETVVLVQYQGDAAALAAAGLSIRGRAGDVWTGTIALEHLPGLAALAPVERLEGARAMHPELDLSLVECRANRVHGRNPPCRGTNVIVGIVDSGCDYTHDCFRRADGTSRILFIWDQGLTPTAGETSPAAFGYGVEYDQAAIDQALLAFDPFAQVRHKDSPAASFHGTHVTGIAAGNGSAPAPNPPGGGPFVGVAPDADIIIVADASNGAEGLGTSANTLDAVNYIYQQAAAAGRAAAVNMSLGDNLGPHDGTSLLERGIDNLLGGPGRAFVKSAGNAGSQGIHAECDVTTQGVRLRFDQPASDATPNQIDLWYEGAATFEISVEDPSGTQVGPVPVGAATLFNLPGGNRIRIDHRGNDAFNGDKRIFLTFAPGSASEMRAGIWSIHLRATAGAGHADAWIQRGTVIPKFLAPHESRSVTISTPGSAREAITAGNYISRAANQSNVGGLAASSSRGPTRDRRAAPTVAAPGSAITSAAGHNHGMTYIGMSGTSMAAPHVTGTAALMLERNASRTQAQIKACLEQTARWEATTGPVPNDDWGAGKMDAEAALDCVPLPGGGD